MVTRNPNALNREDRSVWWDAYLVILPIVLGSNGNLIDRNPKRLGELTSEMAWQALDDYRAAAKGKRP